MGLFRKDIPPYPDASTSEQWSANGRYWVERSQHYGTMAVRCAIVGGVLAVLSMGLAVVSILL